MKKPWSGRFKQSTDKLMEDFPHRFHLIGGFMLMTLLEVLPIVRCWQNAKLFPKPIQKK